MAERTTRIWLRGASGLLGAALLTVPALAEAAPPEGEPTEDDAAEDDAGDDATEPAEDGADPEGSTSAPAASEDATADEAPEVATSDTMTSAEAEGPAEAEASSQDGEGASDGGTDGEGGDADAEAVEMCPCPEPEPVPDPTHITDFTLSAGGLLTTGNANTLAATGKIASTVRRGKHQYTGGFDGNYGLSRADLDAEWLPTTANLEARSRYDGFFVDWATGFVATTIRHDPFQGLNVRWTLDPGVSLYALQRERHTLKFDVGYQLQVDARRLGNILLKDADGLVILDDMGNASRDPELDRTFVNHSLRLAGNYEFKLKDTVKWRLGAEYFQSLLFAEEADRWRINGTTGLDVSLLAGLGLGINFEVRYDNKPLPDVVELDTFSNVTLTYTFKGKAKYKKPE